MKISITFEKTINERRKNQCINQLKTVVDRLNSKQINNSNHSQQSKLSSPQNTVIPTVIQSPIISNIQKKQGKLQQYDKQNQQNLQTAFKATRKWQKKQRNNIQNKGNSTTKTQYQTSQTPNNNQQIDTSTVGILREIQETMFNKFGIIEECMNKLNNKIVSIQKKVLSIQSQQRQQQEDILELKVKQKKKNQDSIVFWERFEQIESRYRNIGGSSHQKSISQPYIHKNQLQDNLLDDYKWQNSSSETRDCFQSYFTK